MSSDRANDPNAVEMPEEFTAPQSLDQFLSWAWIYNGLVPLDPDLQPPKNATPGGPRRDSQVSDDMYEKKGNTPNNDIDEQCDMAVDDEVIDDKDETINGDDQNLLHPKGDFETSPGRDRSDSVVSDESIEDVTPGNDIPGPPLHSPDEEILVQIGACQQAVDGILEEAKLWAQCAEEVGQTNSSTV